jgi:hypothetical protein
MAVTASQDALKAEFAIWYFDPDHTGSQKEWAKEHGIHPVTLTMWKNEEWFLEIGSRWKEHLEKRFDQVMFAAYKRATNTDDFNNQQISAARFIADMLGKTPPKKVDASLNIFTWLQQLGSEEGETKGLLDGLPSGDAQ